MRKVLVPLPFAAVAGVTDSAIWPLAAVASGGGRSCALLSGAWRCWLPDSGRWMGAGWSAAPVEAAALAVLALPAVFGSGFSGATGGGWGGRGKAPGPRGGGKTKVWIFFMAFFSGCAWPIANRGFEDRYSS